jgi:hypothetical protein
MRSKSLLLLALSLACSAATAQFTRLLPQAGELGTTGERLPLPAVKIDKKVLRLAPGAIVVDQNNRTLLHTQLPAGAEVYYTRDPAGDIRRLYVLTDLEKARFKANPPPKTLPAPATAQQ